MSLFVVTGANGFIGTHIVEALLKLEAHELGLRAAPARGPSSPVKDIIQVVGSDLASTLTRSNAQRFMGSLRYDFVPHDELVAQLGRMDEKPVAIIHNGACSSTEETDLSVFSTLNLKYSQDLWKAATELEIPMIYASSASVYGDGSQGFSDAKDKCAELRPMSPYAKSKTDFDLWALEQKTTPPSWFGLRYFNVYGAFESHKGRGASMVYHLYNQITREGKVRLYKSNTPELGDGEQKRDFIYVKDIVHITMELIRISLARKSDPSFRAIDGNGLFLNLGTATARSWNALAHAIFSALQIPSNIEYIAMPEALSKQYQNYTCAEHHGLQKLGLSYNFTPIEEGVAAYVLKYLVRGL